VRVVGQSGQAQEYQSDVKTMIALLQPVMEQYIVTSRRFAVRMALQGGLSEYARGLKYDAVRDVYACRINISNTSNDTHLILLEKAA
jgi:hypothetical protein